MIGEPVRRAAAGAPGDPDRSPSLSDRIRELGPTFLRISHFLSLCPDLINPGIQRELVELGEYVPATPWSAIRTVLNESLGTDIDEVFVSVSTRPLRTGVFTQVHQGELRSGLVVAIKVQRPGVRDMVDRDLENAPKLVELLNDAGAPLTTSPDDLVNELRAWLERDLDLEQEVANIQRFRDLAEESKWEIVPRGYPELSTSRVAVTDLVEGVCVADLLVPDGWDPADNAARAVAAGLRPHRLARDLTLTNLRQIFRYRFFQVDLHPRNLIVTDDGRLSFADYSHFAEIDPSLSELHLDYLAALFDDDLERLLYPPVDVATPKTFSNVSGFRRDLIRGARARVVGGSGVVERSTDTWVDRGLSTCSELIVQVLQAAAVHSIELPGGTQLLYRSVVSAQQVSRLLAPDPKVEELTVEFLRTLQLEVAVRRVRPDSLQPTFLSMLGLARDGPTQLQKLLADLADGSFVLNVYAAEAPQVSRNRDRRTRVVVGAICSVSLALLVTAGNLPRPWGVSVAWFGTPVLVLLYAWLFLQWRRLR